MPSRRLSHLAAFLLVAASTATAVAQSTSITLTSGQITKDNFVTSGSPTKDYGAAGALGVSAAGLPKGEFDSVISFDTLPAFSFFNNQFGVGNWDLLDARLTLVVTAPNNAIFNSPNTGGTVNVSYLTNDGWTEGAGTPQFPGTTGITFNTLGSFTTGEHFLVGVNQATTVSGSVHQFDMLPLYLPMISEIKAGTPISFHLAPGDSSVSLLYNSRSFTTASARPTLFLQAQASAIPEPSSMALAGLASAAMYGYRRRRLRSRVAAS